MIIDHVYQGDCIEVLNSQIDLDSIPLIFADPPYNLSGADLTWKEKSYTKVNEKWDTFSQDDYKNFTQGWIQPCYKVLKPNGSLYVCASYHNLGEILNSIRLSNFKINNIITWHKTNSMPNVTTRVFTHSSEFIVWAVKGANWIFNYQKMKEINTERQQDGSLKQMRDVWSIPLCGGKERLKNTQGKAAHPTQKPESLVERVILASSNPGDIVLDPFLGSGTTAFVAKKHNRHYIGVERSPEYIKLIESRLAIESIPKANGSN